MGFFFSPLLPVSVGYEYESCPDLILWEKRTAVLQGYEIDASKLGGWSLDKHHALNIQTGGLALTNGMSRVMQWYNALLLFTINNSAKGKTHTCTRYSQIIHCNLHFAAALCGQI